MARNCCESFLKGTTSPTKHEAIFIFWKNGPPLYAFTLQLLLFQQAMFVAMFFHIGISRIQLFKENWVLAALQFVPVVLAFWLLWPRLLYFYTASTCLGLMLNDDHIEATVRKVRREQYHHYGLVIDAMQTDSMIFRITNMRKTAEASYEQWFNVKLQMFEEQSQEKKHEIENSFIKTDISKNNLIDSRELTQCLMWVGRSECEAERIAEKWCSGVFSDAKELTREQFFVMQMILEELKTSCDEAIITEWLSKTLDTSGDMMVSAEEFEKGLPSVCKIANLNKERLHKLFFCIENPDQEDKEIAEVEIQKFVIWLKHFSSASSQQAPASSGH